MANESEDQGELVRLLEACLDLADRLDLAHVGAKIAEALDHLRPATGPVSPGG